LFSRGGVLDSKSYHVAQWKYLQGVSTMSFKQKMEQTAKAKKSSVVLALDFPYQSKENRSGLLAKAQGVLAAVSPYICAVKINHHLTLPLGTFDGVQGLIAQAHDAGLLAIMDGKVNDIGATNQTIAEYYFEAGFDALIANPFIGWEEGLKPLFETAARLQPQRGIILLAYMSHKGAAEGYGQAITDPQSGTLTKQYLAFAQKALSFNADGVVVGATVPEKIREIHQILDGKVPIYSPGVGAQGGAAEEALKAGSRYLIVGREIVQAQNPSEQAQKHAKTNSDK
jgi:orotidine-5'-phosphate decarboxylase